MNAEDRAALFIFGGFLMWGLTFLPWISLLGSSWGPSIKYGWMVGGALWSAGGLIMDRYKDD
jgi:hypothetical protein